MKSSFAALVCLLAVNAWGEDLVVRSYPIQPNIRDVVMGADPEKSGMFVEMSDRAPDYSSKSPTAKRFFRTDSDKIQAVLEDCGVTFSTNCYVKYNERLSRLFMKNTEENHQLLVHLLYRWNSLISQIRIDCAFITFEKADIDALARQSPTACPTQEAIQKLWSQGKGRSENSMTLVTRSGVNAQLEAADEIIYPTEFEAASGTNGATCRAFETREAGAILNVTPTVGTDGETIDLTLVPNLTDEPKWQQEEQYLADQKMPQFHNRQVTTSIVMKNGNTVVLGGLANKAKDGVTYLFLTATLVDREGNPIPVYRFE